MKRLAPGCPWRMITSPRWKLRSFRPWMTATISSTEKLRKSGLTTIWAPPGGGPLAGGGPPRAGGGSLKTEGTSHNTSPPPFPPRGAPLALLVVRMEHEVVVLDLARGPRRCGRGRRRGRERRGPRVDGNRDGGDRLDADVEGLPRRGRLRCGGGSRRPRGGGRRDERPARRGLHPDLLDSDLDPGAGRGQDDGLPLLLLDEAGAAPLDVAA